MALQQLGVQMVVRGAERFARDMSHVALSMYAYSKAVSIAERSMIAYTTRGVKSAESAMNNQKKVVDNLTAAYQKQGQIVAGLADKVAKMRSAIAQEATARLKFDEVTARVKSLNNAIKEGTQIMNGMKDKGSAAYFTLSKQVLELYKDLVKTKAELSNWSNIIKTAERGHRDLANTTKQLADETSALDDIYSKLGTENQKLVQDTDAHAKAQSQLNSLISNSGGIFQTLGKFMSVLSGQFGQSVVGATNLETTLLRLGLQGAAVGVALNTVSLALDAVAIAAKVTMGIIMLFFNALGKVAGVIINVGKAIVGYLWDGFKKLAALPFQIIIGGLTGIWNSIKRIGEIAIGMNISNLIWHIGAQLKNLGDQAIEAAGRFQLLQIRLTGLFAREMVDASGGTLEFADAMAEAKVKAQDLSYWISELAIKSIFSAEDISNTLTLAMAYDFTSGEAKDLTLAITNFATGMGLTDEQMRRIIENFGQMKAAGKAAGTELRDLARGSFVPVNTIFDMMGKRLGIVGKNIGDVRQQIQEKIASGEIPINEFFKEFINLSSRDFPNAIENASSSWTTVKSNIKDFIDSVLGWRIITPTLDIVSKRLADFMQQFMQPAIRSAAEKIGNGIAFMAKGILTLSDALTPVFLKDLGRFASMIEVILNALSLLVKNSTSVGTAFQSIQAALKMIGVSGPGVDKVIKSVIRFTQAVANIGKGANIGDDLKELWASFKDVMGSVWTGLIVPEIKKIWEETLKPKLQELWGFISGFIADLWQNKIPEWWNSTGEPAFNGLIDSIITWITTSDSAKEIGRRIVGAIRDGMGKIEESGILDVLTSGLTSLATAAATTVMNTITGILQGGGTATEDNTPSQYKEAAGASTSQTINELSTAFERLNSAASGAFKESIAGFLATLQEKSPALFAFTKIFLGFVYSVELFGKIAAQFMDPITKIGDALINIITNIMGASGEASMAGGGKTSVLDKLAESIGKLAALPLDFIAYNITAISNAIATLTGGAATENTGGEGLLGGIVSGITSIIDNVIQVVGRLATEMPAKAAEASTGVVEAFTTMGNQLVWGSIIPDIVNAIFTIMTTTLTTLLGWINTSFIAPLSAAFNAMDLYAAGQRIVQTLWDGLAAGIPALLAWWATVKAQFHITASVSFSYPGAGAESGGSGGQTQGPAKPGDKPVGAKKGANFIVPPGYSRDNFRMNVSSGEQVIVIPNAITSMQNRTAKNMPFTLSQNVMGGMGNSYSNSLTNQYNLSVNAPNRTLENLVTEYEIMRLIGENG